LPSTQKMTANFKRLVSLPIFNITDPVTDGHVEWRFPTMFKTDAKGVSREWFGGVLDGGVITCHGTTDGVKTLSEPYRIELNLSGRSFVEQALLELRSRYEVKNRKEGYRFPDEIKTINPKPMLAEDWHKKRPSMRLYFPVAVQPKLDGIRCLVSERRDEGNIVYRSRTNKYYDFGYLFDEEISAILPFFPFQVELDGELYIHGRMLQNISSIVSLKATDLDLKKMSALKAAKTKETLDIRKKELVYNIFTIITPKDLSYEERRHFLVEAFSQGERSLGRPFERISLVPDFEAYSEEDIKKYTNDFLDKGYEGAMIYKMAKNLPPGKKNESFYRSARTWNLMKFKAFSDEEMIAVSITEGKGLSEGKAICQAKDKNGILHSVNLSFTDDEKRDIFLNPSKIIGKEVTVKHYGRTEDGKLRHANVISIRDYE
jgi:ATP-dependent DNA ligase